MASKTLFKSAPAGARQVGTTTVNAHGAGAYQLDNGHQLLQYAMTGTLQRTFYASAETQLEKIVELCGKVSPKFVAQAAIFAREKGYMKDAPALLVSYLAGLSSQQAQEALQLREQAGKGTVSEAQKAEYLEQAKKLEDAQVETNRCFKAAFAAVMNSGSMIRNFVQMIRSGVLGRKSLGHAPRQAINSWLLGARPHMILNGTVGQSPALADVIKLSRPKPSTPQLAATFGWVLGKEYDEANLPPLIKEFEAFKKSPDTTPAPNVDFRLLTSVPLAKATWKQLSKNLPWNAMKKNLNTMHRHGVFQKDDGSPDQEMIQYVCNRLKDPEQLEKAKVFPYEILAAWTYMSLELPREIRLALEEAMNAATVKIPEIQGKVVVCVDTSGSMDYPVTGQRDSKDTSSKVTCRMAAATVAGSVLRRNPGARIIPFATDVAPFSWDSNDGIMTTASRLNTLPKGGTKCSAPLALLNKENAPVDVVIMLSDYESWVDKSLRANTPPKSMGMIGASGNDPTATMKEWDKLKQRCPNAKFICIDLTPSDTVQTLERDDITNIGGFSDWCFEVIADVAAGRSHKDHWLRQVAQVQV